MLQIIDDVIFFSTVQRYHVRSTQSLTPSCRYYWHENAHALGEDLHFPGRNAPPVSSPTIDPHTYTNYKKSRWDEFAPETEMWFAREPVHLPAPLAKLSCAEFYIEQQSTTSQLDVCENHQIISQKQSKGSSNNVMRLDNKTPITP